MPPLSDARPLVCYLTPTHHSFSCSITFVLVAHLAPGLRSHLQMQRTCPHTSISRFALDPHSHAQLQGPAQCTLPAASWCTGATAFLPPKLQWSCIQVSIQPESQQNLRLPHDLQVRSITCWTLSRYAHWVVANGQDPHSLGQLQFDLVIEVNRACLMLSITRGSCCAANAPELMPKSLLSPAGSRSCHPVAVVHLGNGTKGLCADNTAGSL